MEFQVAADEFLFYMEDEKNYSRNTLRGYAHDLQCFQQFFQPPDGLFRIKS